VAALHHRQHPVGAALHRQVQVIRQLGHLGEASIRLCENSTGCEVVKRMRSMPSIAAT
jgi:hypothetical protein